MTRISNFVLSLIHEPRPEDRYRGRSRPSDGAGSLSRAGDLFQLLRDGKARTRAELALTTGLARSTVAARIDALISSGLVGPAGEASSSGGRPPSRFAFNPAARAVLAVDVGATHVIVAVTDLGGNVLSERRLAQDVADGPETVLDPWPKKDGRLPRPDGPRRTWPAWASDCPGPSSTPPAGR